MSRLSEVLALILFVAASAFVTSNPTEQGTVGDVRYSMLKPEVFRRLNGSGWELLEGQRVGPDEALCTQGDWCLQLPDARGVFIRGVNGSRSPSEGDPDSTRQVGSAQEDALRRHNHTDGQQLYLAKVDGHHTAHETDNSDGELNIKYGERIASAGGSETRPRNIALYVYVKVN